MERDTQLDKLREVIRKTVIRLFPELGNRFHLFARGQLISKGTEWQIEQKDIEGKRDQNAPVLRIPPLPYSIAVGDSLNIGYLYGDRSEPFAIPKSAAAIGVMVGSTAVHVDGYGTRPAIIAEHLVDSVSGDTVAAVPIEEGNRFIVFAKINI